MRRSAVQGVGLRRGGLAIGPRLRRRRWRRFGLTGRRRSRRPPRRCRASADPRGIRARPDGPPARVRPARIGRRRPACLRSASSALVQAARERPPSAAAGPRRALAASTVRRVRRSPRPSARSPPTRSTASSSPQDRPLVRIRRVGDDLGPATTGSTTRRRGRSSQSVTNERPTAVGPAMLELSPPAGPSTPDRGGRGRERGHAPEPSRLRSSVARALASAVRGAYPVSSTYASPRSRFPRASRPDGCEPSQYTTPSRRACRAPGRRPSGSGRSSGLARQR
jgi:hypothetical protein